MPIPNMYTQLLIFMYKHMHIQVLNVPDLDPTGEKKYIGLKLLEFPAFRIRNDLSPKIYPWYLKKIIFLSTGNKSPHAYWGILQLRSPPI